MVDVIHCNYSEVKFATAGRRTYWKPHWILELNKRNMANRLHPITTEALTITSNNAIRSVMKLNNQDIYKSLDITLPPYIWSDMFI